MARLNRLPFLTLILVSLLAGAPARAADKAPASAANSDQTAETLLQDMKADKYAAAYAMFDDRMKQALSEEKLGTVWSQQIGAFGALQSWKFTTSVVSQGLDVRIALLTFEHGALRATIAIHPDTQEVAGFLLKPAPSAAKPAPPAAYVRPSDFRASDISVGKAPFVLGGTLTVPVGLGPFPAAILVHGSGPQDRDETIAANKVFKDIAEGLASRGIEVLRYDKRTFVYGAQMGDSVSVDDEVMVDAGLALDALRARPEVDAQHLYVIGHSMGALLAPEIGVRFGPVAGVILMAPPGRPVEDIVLEQARYMNTPPHEMATLELQVAKLKAGTLGTERFVGAPQSYWKDLAKHDGIAMAKKLGKPVLVMRGDRDFQVAQADFDAWKKGLAGTPNVEFVVIPGLSHLFIAGEGKPSPSEYDKPGHVDARVIDKLASFIAPTKK